ncbi:MAG: hypothetical protein ACL93V_07965 [Candidatus Electrothrix sp. YB6]
MYSMSYSMKGLLLFFSILLLLSTPAAAGNITVQVISGDGYIFPTYPTDSRDGSYRAYLQAQRNARYGIRIRNNTGRRIGLVIAVDGRNIISGDRSDLRNTERMYILGPYEEATYNGWRTTRNQVSRFYFSDAEDSYAGAWGDHSAMGVIAVAAYPEKRRRFRHRSHRPRLFSQRSVPTAPRSKYGAADSAPGTGYGEGEYSSSVEVSFRPKRYPLEKQFYKYEWRRTLCRKGIISCRRPHHHRDRNRFWPNENSGNNGYAPPPPKYWRR